MEIKKSYILNAGKETIIRAIRDFMNSEGYNIVKREIKVVENGLMINSKAQVPIKKANIKTYNRTDYLIENVEIFISLTEINQIMEYYYSTKEPKRIKKVETEINKDKIKSKIYLK
jgi:hypothetical protein